MCGSHESTQLAVLWASADREVAETMVFEYVRNAKTNKWWRHITLIVWGPSVRLLTGDEGLQAETRALIELGVRVEASVAAADKYGTAEKLKELGVAVKAMGLPLTEMLQDEDWSVLTV